MACALLIILIIILVFSICVYYYRWSMFEPILQIINYNPERPLHAYENKFVKFANKQYPGQVLQVNGNNVMIGEDKHMADQKWLVVHSVDDKYRLFNNGSTNKLLFAINNSNVVVDDDETANSNWKLTMDGLHWKIASVANVDHVLTASTNNVKLGQYAASSNQLWTIIPADD